VNYNKNKFISIKGFILNKEQIQEYMRKLAVEYETKEKSSITTYPIPRLNDNFKFIEKTYNLLNEHIKKNINIYSAGEWLLDNFYIIEETVKRIRFSINAKEYKNFKAIANGTYKDFARIYVLASEIVACADNIINEEVLKISLQAYENERTLKMEEIWNLPLFLEISIIENIRKICEKIYINQIQKERVEDIVSRLIEKKDTFKQSYKLTKEESSIYKNKRYSFIEYMSYKLKRYGKQGTPYLDILEQEVNKTGITISEAIKKEHVDMAIQKVSMGNSITSLREISRISFLNLFEEINGVEEILKKDPSNVYIKMDYKTKEHYRNSIKILSEKSKVSEIYIAKKVLELAQSSRSDKKRHIGYYLISDGIDILKKEIGIKVKKKRNKAKLYIYSIFAVTTVLSILFGLYIFYKSNLTLAVISGILAYIPISEIYIQILNYIFIKMVKPKVLPKLDFTNGIPKEYGTIVVIPTIIGNSEKVKELFRKLEIYYLANKSENLYFALLGDCTSSNNEIEEFDEEVVSTGIAESERLNKKYGDKKFSFLYRKRTWNTGEHCYLGWERKRGLLCEFNDYLVSGENKFKENNLDRTLEIKYVITLDADTNLVLETAKQLVGAMAHILNTPVLDKQRNVVIEGHALIQPRVGVELNASRKSIFTKIYAGSGGTDSYANAISDVYQDNFDEGIFTGKGIYDLELFHKILSKEIPENKVLSHDLLEGSYLRCGLASDILLLDGTPFKYSSYMVRGHRWVRGDWQICGWLKSKIKIKDRTTKINPLNKLAKFKIFDNLRRSLLSIFVILLILSSVINFIITKKFIWSINILALIAYSIPTLLDLVNFVIFKKNINPEFVSAHKNMVKVISGIQASIYRGILEISFLPYKAYMMLNAIIKTIYRLTISKQNLLEWMTSEEAEKQSKNTLNSYYKNMAINSILGGIFIIIGIIYTNIYLIIIGLLFAIGPFLAYFISQEYKKVEKITSEERTYLLDIGERTWRFFSDNINEKNNFLPPDNYQEDRKEQVAYRTSPTNIGLGLLAVCSAYDLKYIELDKCLELLSKMLQTISRMPKWEGHLYNWYNTLNLEPLIPRYISTVDSGNFVGYLYTLKQFLLDINIEEAKELISIVDKLIQDTNFSILYDYKKKIFSIGFNVEENKLTDSYYDLLASEARQASLIAIAKHEVPSKHWNNLSRTLTTLNKYKGLVSWSGTAFEYLMPNINVKSYKGSLLDESCRFMIMSQKEYAKKLGTPWGISEAAFNLRDLNNNYQYKAFGIPWLGLKRGLEEDMVISPYSIFLSMKYDIKESINNLKRLEKENMYDKYGFYESIDYTIARLKYGNTAERVKTYMAHHQGLILLSINNLINKEILVERFSKNPEIEAIDILLQERMPEKAIITKEKKEKVEKLKIKNHENYIEKVYTKVNKNLNNCNIISNGTYTICNTIEGTGFSKYNNILVNRYKETADYKQGIFFYIKNLNNKQIWKNTPNDNSKIVFAPDRTEFQRRDGNIDTKTKIIVSPEDNVEIRRLELKNIGNNTETLEITSCFEPVLSTDMQDYAHTAFNNLFLIFNKTEDGSILIKRKKRGEKQKDVFLGVNLYTENGIIGDVEYEIDKEKFAGVGNFKMPESVKNSKPHSKKISLVTEPEVAIKKTLRIMSKETVKLDLIICISHDEEKVNKMLKEYTNMNNLEKTFELSKAQAEAENIYLGITGKNIETYQKMLAYLILQNPMKKELLNKLPERIYSQSELWKYGISGDLPILLVRIKDINDIDIIEECLKAIEFFRAKNIKIDLIILNEEKNSYENYMKFEIEDVIQNKQLSYLKNVFGGIFIINKKEIKAKDVDLLRFRANLELDASLGSIRTQINDMEEDYERTVMRSEEKRNAIIFKDDRTETLALEEYDNLKYYNEYGGFSENGLEYKMKLNKENKLPTVWSMVLANPKFGTVVTQNLGGFTWNKNSRLSRISAWNNNPLVDIPSEIIYVKDKKTGEFWSLSENINQRMQEYYITYGFGYVYLKTLKNQIIQEVETFVAKDDRIKINILKLTNTSSEKKKLKLLYYIKPVIGEDEIKTSGYIKVSKENNIIMAKNLYANELKNGVVYCSSNEKIKSFTGSKLEFVGHKDIDEPQAISLAGLGDSNGLGEKSCIAMEVEVELEAYENKELVLLLGEEDNVLDAKNMAYKYSKVSNCKQELNEVKRYWYELLTRIQVKTPIESMNIMLNGWAVYQTITARLWAKSGYYQSGGATRF